jgi:uncharacterized RDD family membrane protein YckC
MTSARAPLADRLVAAVLDLLLVLAWVAVLAAVGAALWALGVAGAFDPVAGNVVGFVTLVAPVTLVAAAFESRGWTPGKRARGLRVVRAARGAAGGAPGFGRAVLRNALKIAVPWQLGHTVVFSLFGTTFTPPPGVLVLLVVTYAIPLAYAVTLLIPPRRALYDSIAGTAVERAPHG